MVFPRDVMDKANVKEFVAFSVAMGLVKKAVNYVVDRIRPNATGWERAAVQALVGEGFAYLFNELAERYPAYREYLELAGLTATAVAAMPIAEQIEAAIPSIAGVAKPVVVRANVEQGANVRERKRAGITL